MIVFDNVKLQYPYDEFELLKGVSFVLDSDVNTVLCDTQSGKTSLCRLLCKDTVPSSGEIFLNEKPLSGITCADLGILYLPNDPVFFEGRSALYNVAYPLKVRKVPPNERNAAAASLLESCGIDPKIKMRKLSCADRRKVALARGKSVRRDIVLFDDFFETAAEADGIFAEFCGAVKVIVTSNPDLARGKTAVLDGGITVYQGDAEGAKQVVSQLPWIEFLRRKNG